MDKNIVRSLKGMEVQNQRTQSQLGKYTPWGSVNITNKGDYIEVNRGTATSGWGLVTSQEESVFGNTTYTIEFDYMTDDLSKLSYCYIISRPSGNQPFTPIDLIADGQWHKVSIRIVPTQDRYNAGILIGSDHRHIMGDTFKIKNFKLYPTYIDGIEKREAKEILSYIDGKWKKTIGHVFSKNNIKSILDFNNLDSIMEKLGISYYHKLDGIHNGFQLNCPPLESGKYVISNREIEEEITVVNNNIQPGTSKEWAIREFKGWQSYFERIKIDPKQTYITGSGYINPLDYEGRLMFTFWLDGGGYTQSHSNIIQPGESGYATVSVRIPNNCSEVAFALRHVVGTTPINRFRFKEIKVEYGLERTPWVDIGNTNYTSTTGVKGDFKGHSVLTRDSLDKSEGYYIEFLRPEIQVVDDSIDVTGMYILDDNTLRDDGIRFGSQGNITVETTQIYDDTKDIYGLEVIKMNTIRENGIKFGTEIQFTVS